MYVFIKTTANGNYVKSKRIHVFIKNPNLDYFQDGRIKKGTEYIQIDMEILMNSLQLGQTCEMSNAYVGMTNR
ncbi:hypothetical protein FORC087_592 (plasmid) [Bacillus cereus]|nr:hypothetical protein FORC087_592 [Bacillus cereus]